MEKIETKDIFILPNKTYKVDDEKHPLLFLKLDKGYLDIRNEQVKKRVVGTPTVVKVKDVLKHHSFQGYTEEALDMYIQAKLDLYKE